MKLDCVTMTGADDSVEPQALKDLSQEFPFVEWGILFSERRMGTPRFPSRDWFHRLTDGGVSDLKLSAHLCGQLVRDYVINGRFTFMADPCHIIFDRIQLNFHAIAHQASQAFIDHVKRHSCFGTRIILQMDGKNNDILNKFTQDDLVYPLFDTSGGAGILPSQWPAPIPPYCGYAGGLGPHNLKQQLTALNEHINQAIWVDMETHIRSDHDRQFDLAKVRECLLIAKEFIT